MERNCDHQARSLIPEVLQQRFAGIASSNVVESVDAAHMLVLSKPMEVTQLIENHATA